MAHRGFAQLPTNRCRFHTHMHIYILDMCVKEPYLETSSHDLFES